MCGIAGIVGHRPVETPTVKHMTDLLAHRGPDDSGLWNSSDGLVALGHRRLSVIDTGAGGHQPMKKNQSVITYNGEIYNYIEIRERLIRLGAKFESRSDTEVLITAYQHWGEKCLNELNGMFAFAIYDKARKTLFCARDRFGEKPFLFTSQIDFFAFASEFKPLLRLNGVNDYYDQTKLLRFLQHSNTGLDDEQATLFPAIQQLLPAHSLTLDLKTLTYKIKKYWEPTPNSEFTNFNQVQAESRFKEILSNSVKIRMRSDVPIGSCLSGGLDSSSITCLVKGFFPAEKRYLSFTGRFPNTEADEWIWAKKIIDLHNIEAHTVEPKCKDLIDELENFTWYNELPVGSTSQYAQWCVFRLAKENNIVVLLDGQGGDEILGGYEQYFRNYLASVRSKLTLLEFQKEKARIRKRYPLALLNPTQIVKQNTPKEIRQVIARMSGLGSDFALGLKPDVANTIYTEPLKTNKFHNELNPLTEILWKESLQTNLPVLLRYGDRNSMAHSREVRLPFCDHRLLELALSLRPEVLMGKYQTKRVLRGAMKGIVPDTTLERWGKQGFLPPQAAWFHGGLVNYARDIIESPDFNNEGIWETTWWQSVLARFEKGNDHLASTLWRPVVYDSWRRYFYNKIRILPKLPIFENRL